MTLSVFDLVLAVLSVIVAPFVVQGVMKAKSRLGKALQIVVGIGVVITFLVVWGATKKDPLQLAFCAAVPQAPACIRDPATPPAAPPVTDAAPPSVETLAPQQPPEQAAASEAAGVAPAKTLSPDRQKPTASDTNELLNGGGTAITYSKIRGNPNCMIGVEQTRMSMRFRLMCRGGDGVWRYMEDPRNCVLGWDEKQVDCTLADGRRVSTYHDF